MTFDLNNAGIPNASITAPKLDGAQIGSAPIYGVRAWVNFTSIGTLTVRGSGNVSSITDNGQGDFTVNFATALPTANYAVSGSANSVSATNSQAGINLYATNLDGTGVIKTTSSCRILAAQGSVGAPTDYGQISVFFIG